jgi:FixJ family two-component response regulator
MSTIFIVDDDPNVLRALTRLMRLKGYDVQSHDSAQDFLARQDPSIPGCAVVDVSLPGMDGLQLQQVLTTGGVQRPVIFITGKGDIPTSVRAMKAGAVDFLTKPVSKEDLLAAVCRAVEQDTRARQVETELAAIQARVSTLTPRERQVLGHVVAGRLNKQIAYDLGTVEKTIKFHRGALMKKLAVRSVADMVRLAGKAGLAR